MREWSGVKSRAHVLVFIQYPDRSLTKHVANHSAVGCRHEAEEDGAIPWEATHKSTIRPDRRKRPDAFDRTRRRCKGNGERRGGASGKEARQVEPGERQTIPATARERRLRRTDRVSPFHEALEGVRSGGPVRPPFKRRP